VRIKIKEIVKKPCPAHCPGCFMLSSRLALSLAAFSGFQQPSTVPPASLVPISSLTRHLVAALLSSQALENSGNPDRPAPIPAAGGWAWSFSVQRDWLLQLGLC